LASTVSSDHPGNMSDCATSLPRYTALHVPYDIVNISAVKSVIHSGMFEYIGT